MKTIKSNKSNILDLEDFIEDELDNKCKKTKKKKNKKKKKSSNKKSFNKKNNKKNKKSKKQKKKKLPYYDEIELSFFNLSDKELNQVKRLYDENDDKENKGFLNRLLKAINLDAKIKVDITDETIQNIILGIGTIITTIISARKAIK